MSLHRVAARPTRRESQSDRDDDGVVGIAENGDEIRNQVDRRQQVEQKNREPDSNTTRYGSIGGEALEQPRYVGRESNEVTKRSTTRMPALLDPENQNESQPQDQQPAEHAQSDLPPGVMSRSRAGGSK